MWPEVSIILITYNQCEIVLKTVQELLKQDYPTNLYEIIVLIDGSSDSTQKELEAISKEISPKKLRILNRIHEADYMNAKRWNECISAASPQTKIFIQLDDVIPKNDLIKQHVKWHLVSENLIVTGSKFEGKKETWNLKNCRRNFLSPMGKPVFCDFQAAWGASLSFTKKTMNLTFNPPFDRPYDERMSGWGYQETEFIYRLENMNVRIVYDPSAGVFHKNHSNKTEGQRNMKRDNLVSIGTRKNIEYLCKKHRLEYLPDWRPSIPIDDELLQEVENYIL